MSVSKKMLIGKFAALLVLLLSLLTSSAKAEDVVFVTIGAPAHVFCDVHLATTVELRANGKIARIQADEGTTVHCDHDVDISSQDKPWSATAEACTEGMCSMRMLTVALPAYFLPIIWGVP